MKYQSPTELLGARTVPEKALLRVLANSHGRGLNTGELVAHLACELGGVPGERLRQLAMLLSCGEPVVSALRQVPDVLDAANVMALHLAETDNKLPEMYQRLLDPTVNSSRDADADELRPGSGIFRSFFGVFLAMTIVSFIMMFVIPNFTRMFDEFGLELPSMMASLIVVADFLPTVLLLPMIGIVVYVLYKGHSMKQSLVRRFSAISFQRQSIPSGVSLLSLLAIACQSSRPLRDGIATLAAAHPVAAARQKLARTNERIERGEDPIWALASERVISTRELSSLAQSKSSETQSWLFHWFAAQRWNRSKVWVPLMATTLSTIATLILAFITGWLAIAVIMTLMSLVGGLA